MVEAPLCSACSAHSGGLFACLSPRQVARLLEIRIAHAYEPGQPLYYQGNPPLAVYCIHQGTIKLSRMLRGGGEHIVGTRSAGDVTGYRAVLGDKPYTVSAEPLERTIACAIPREAFVELLRENNRLALALLTRLAGDSLETEEQLIARTAERVPTRCARFLIQQLPAELRAPKGPLIIPLHLSREEMAHMIDTTPRRCHARCTCSPSVAFSSRTGTTSGCSTWPRWNASPGWTTTSARSRASRATYPVPPDRTGRRSHHRRYRSSSSASPAA